MAEVNIFILLCDAVQYPATVRAFVSRGEGGDRRAFVQVDIMRVEIAFPCNTGRERRRERRRDTGKTDGFSRMEIISFSEKISSSFIFERISFSNVGE